MFSRALLAGLLVACGRVGFDPLTTTDGAPSVGCVREAVIGGDHTCAIREDDELWCWGSNVVAQLGIGTRASSPDATTVYATGVTLAFAGRAHACAQQAAGSLACWGSNQDGQLGDQTLLQRAVPVPVVPALVATAGDGGEDFTCAVTADGTYCWGANDAGQLADGTTLPHSTPTRIADVGQPAFSTIAAGGAHVCALGIDNSVWCWGDNSRGQLGVGDQMDRTVPTRVIGSSARLLSAARNYTCAVDLGGGVSCWGSDDDGHLGNGLPLADSTVPVTVSGLPTTPPPYSLDLGEVHACVVLGDGTVRCWGRHNGRLGDGDPDPTTNFQPSSVIVTGIADGREVASGVDSTCVRRATGDVTCWGQNDAGELGRSNYFSATAPVVSAISGSTKIVMAGRRACSIDGQGSLACWGSNGDGELGDGSATNANAPMFVAARVRAAAAGTSFTCAIFDDGGVRCWGSGTNGKLGFASALPIATPTPVTTTTGLSQVVQLDTGDAYACATTSDGAVFCWGSNFSGQLGDNSTSTRTQPIRPMFPTTALFAEVQAGTNHTCARDTEGRLWCWGGNGGGRLGDNTTTQRLVPVPVMMPATVTATALTIGADMGCLTDGTGGAYCWGENAEGDLGIGTTTDARVPMLTSLSGIDEISAGDQFTCARTGGTVTCWGENDSGALGDGSQIGRDRPGAPIDLPVLRALATGHGPHACAITTTGQLWCWGDGSSGQLTGTTEPIALPRLVDVPCP